MDFPSYYAFKAIKQSKEFLNSFNKDKVPSTCLKFEELKKINSIRKLGEEISSPELIYKIEIDGSNDGDIIKDLNVFENTKFNELTKLHLQNIKELKDIKALTICHFPKLKKLIIENEELGNDFIDVIKNLKLPEIKYISFFNNKITSPEIFGTIEHFQSLEKFYIGYNPIEFKDFDNKNIKYKFPPNLIELGISNNFTNETNHFIFELFNLENIKSLFINVDRFTSLKMFKQTTFNQLEELWVRGSDKGYLESIEDLKYLEDIKSTKKIILKQNKIKDIEKLIDIISSFQNLKLLNIEDNEIEKEKVEITLKKIEEKGFKELKVQY